MASIPDAGGMVRLKGTGEQIRDYLESVDSDFEMNIWRAVKEECIEAGVRYPTWESFRNYMSRLRALKLILPAEMGMAPSTASAGRSEGAPYERRYYKLNPTRINDAAWRNPQPYYLEYLQRRRELGRSR